MRPICRNGEMESVFIDMPRLGMSAIAPVEQARGSLFSACRRLGRGTPLEPVIAEQALYEPRSSSV
jgi:hypothetical protein